MSKRVQIDVPCRLHRSDGGTEWWEVTQGELLHDIAPHLAHICTFAVCFAPCGSGIFNNYVVMSLETGLRIGDEHATKEKAISAARKVLKVVSPEYAVFRINEERPEGE